MLLRLLTLAFVLMMTTPIFAQIPTIETGVPQTLAKWRGANYSDVRYKLNLTLEKMSPTLKGTIEIRVKIGEQGRSLRVSKGANDTSEDAPLLTRRLLPSDDAPHIILDWRKIRGKEDLSTVSNISVNGRFVVLNPDSNQLSAGKILVEGAERNYYEINEHLVFKDGVTKGENVIKLDFTSPIATSGAAITRYVDKEDGAEYIYSLFVPSDASTAFPVFDQPDLKARFTLNVLLPVDWKAVSNTQGQRTDKLVEDYKTVSKNDLEVVLENRRFIEIVFPETKPISTYVFAFAAGDFMTVDENVSAIKSENISGMALASRMKDSKPQTIDNSDELLEKVGELSYKIYIRKSQAEKFKAHAKEVFRLNREAVKYLESYFDYKFPFPKYDLVLIPEFPFGGMEHAGATFLRESSVIFPNEPTKNDYVSRANLIFHEAAHQWFGDTVTMKWFDDLWLKEGFAEFMAYKTLAQVMPEYNAWKIFYERNKQLAYLTDSTRGTTPIYQEIANLSSAKSAYGNIVYRKAPSFLKQAEFYLGEKEFQTAVRAFLKKHEFTNAEWTDLVKEFEIATDQDLKAWAKTWVTQKGLPIINLGECRYLDTESPNSLCAIYQSDSSKENKMWKMKTNALMFFFNGSRIKQSVFLDDKTGNKPSGFIRFNIPPFIEALFPNSDDYGYGIFLLDEKSRAYVLENIQSEKDDFLRTMMWGALWDSVRETELAPKDYVELVIKNINVEKDESTINTLLNRVGVAMNYYLSEPPAVAGGLNVNNQNTSNATQNSPATAGGSDIAPKLETLLIEKMQKSETLGQRITFYRAFLNLASSENARQKLKEILNLKFQISDFKLKTKDNFDIVTRLLILGDKDAPNLLTKLEKTETSDEAKRYAYAAKAGIANRENKAKFWNDFVNNKDISESWIEAAFVSFNSVRHADLTLPFLEKALAELPNLKRNRKIFFVNGWLSAFIGGQKSEEAVQIVNKFLADNPNLDRDLRLKILENADGLERAVKIRSKF